MISLRSASGLVASLLAATACGTQPALAPSPAANAERTPVVRAGPPADTAQPTEAPAERADDAAADEAALEALRELEFRSLTKGAGHVQGVLAPPDLSALALADARPAPARARGGAAGLAAPTYDIDVTSFAGYDRVQYYRGFFLGEARDRFTIWLGRLNRYEGMIRATFRARGVPEDLVYLGLIESGYSNTAVSRANAVGMWQFIASTARMYGLRVNTWVDERRDPFKATDAAARHLADLKALFGSWYLAAAAYNGGARRVERGIERLRYDPDSLTDETFFDLSRRRYLRRETRDYVPKLIAAALVAKDPGRYGFHAVPYQAPLAFDEITVPAQTGLDVIAELADTTARALMELNPQYVRGVTPPKTAAIVRVPRGSGPLVLQRYAELPPAARVNFVEHRVRKGETLSEIGQRYGVGVRLLRAANGNVDPRRLSVGRVLVVPVSSAAQRQAASGRAPAPHRGVPGVKYHTVRRGDTLWGLSRRYGVRIRDLRAWNDMEVDEVLRAGRRVRVAP